MYTQRRSFFHHCSIRVLVAGALFYAFTGCANKPVVRSTLLSNATVGDGVVYSLPKQYALIKFKREAADFDKLLEAYEKQAKATEGAAKASSEAKSKVDSIKKQLEKAPETGAARDELQKQLEIAQAEFAVADLANKKAQLALAQAKQALQKRITYDDAFNRVEQLKSNLADLAERVKQLGEEIKELQEVPDGETTEQQDMRKKTLAAAEAEMAKLTEAVRGTTTALLTAQNALQKAATGLFRDTFTVELQTPVPDPEWTFVARHVQSARRHDEIEIKTSASGLLEGLVGTSEDKTGEILLKSIELFGKLQAVTKTTTTQSVLLAGAAPPAPEPVEVAFLVDPTATCGEMTLQKASATLQHLGAGYVLTLDPTTHSRFAVARDKVAPESKDSDPAVWWREEPSSQSLFYRRPIMHVLIVKTQGDAYVDSFPLLIPNDGPIGKVRFEAGTAVKTENTFTFKDGMLTSSNQIHPSEALAVVSFPIDLLTRLIAIPSELLQLKIDYSSKDKAVADAQKAYIDSQIALLKAQKDLEAERAETATPAESTP